MKSKTPTPSPAQPPAPAKTTRRRRRITPEDVDQICYLTECHRLNFREATELLNINYDTWRSWKDRAKNLPHLTNTVARVKAAWVEGRLRNIHDAETGKNGHRPDWRASKALLEMAAPERYAPQAPRAPDVPPPVSIGTFNKWLVWAQEPEKNEAKALPDAAPAPDKAFLDGPGREAYSEAAVEGETRPAKRRAPKMLTDASLGFATANHLQFPANGS